MRSPERFAKRNSAQLKRNLVYSTLLFGIGALFGGVVSVFIFMYVTGGSATPSEPISAPPLSTKTSSTQSTTEPLIQPTEESVPVIVNTFEVETPEASAPAAATAIPTAAPIPQPQLFRIVSAESEARFSVAETFPRGVAVGKTNQIAGELLVDFANPSNSQLGTIRINLRTLQTDDPDRDRSIRCCVLLTAQDAYEFTDFVPTAITGLPESPVGVGQTIPFSVTGDLTLRGNTSPVTFSVRLEIINIEEIQGFATATVDRNLFGILNNDENGFDYHGVEDNVLLDFTFVARAVSE